MCYLWHSKEHFGKNPAENWNNNSNSSNVGFLYMCRFYHWRYDYYSQITVITFVYFLACTVEIFRIRNADVRGRSRNSVWRECFIFHSPFCLVPPLANGLMNVVKINIDREKKKTLICAFISFQHFSMMRN